ncbi:MAG: adenine-specific methyltransferase EcoRI family protein [Kiritimatiellae bacterium]|nr:adenine-specific methyltransferase EcoRI family protein [Kiritimatiellia bacterium]
MANKNLSNAKNAKNDEFYTQLNDIQAEVNAYIDYDPDVFRGKTLLLPCDDPEWSNFTRFFAQNFERFGLKKLISTSYAASSKKISVAKNAKGKRDVSWYQPTLFEQESPQYDEDKTAVRGKIFVLDHDTNANGRIDFEDLEWKYLEGDGDFRSEEVCRLRDEADMIVTNPPFSLFREFLAWIVGADGCDDLTRRRGGAESAKKFLIIGNMNAVSYTEVFPLIKNNDIWLGATGFANDMVFAVPKGTVVSPSDKAKAERLGYVGDYTRLGNSCWFTNIEHGRRHQPLRLMTKADNVKFSRHKDIRGIGYLQYENYPAIEVPYTDAIPSDYDGAMAVPRSFLDKYCPEQFEIVGIAEGESGKELGLKAVPKELKRLNKSLRDGQLYYMKDGFPEKPFARILIRARRSK